MRVLPLASAPVFTNTFTYAALARSLALFKHSAPHRSFLKSNVFEMARVREWLLDWQLLNNYFPKI